VLTKFIDIYEYTNNSSLSSKGEEIRKSNNNIFKKFLSDKRSYASAENFLLPGVNLHNSLIDVITQGVMR